MMQATDPRGVISALAREGGDSLAALSAMLGRNAAYLQQYVRRGTPRVLAERDRRLLAAYFGVAETILGAEPASAPPLRVPRLSIAASAGPGSFVDDEIVTGADQIGADFARQLGLTPGNAATIRVRGDSMEPGLVDGDHILVDTADRHPGAKGGVFVIRVDEVVMVKRVAMRAGALVATSDNPAAPPVPSGPIAVIGRVVWQMRVPR